MHPGQAGQAGQEDSRQQSRHCDGTSGTGHKTGHSDTGQPSLLLDLLLFLADLAVGPVVALQVVAVRFVAVFVGFVAVSVGFVAVSVEFLAVYVEFVTVSLGFVAVSVKLVAVSAGLVVVSVGEFVGFVTVFVGFVAVSVGFVALISVVALARPAVGVVAVAVAGPVAGLS